MYDNNFKLIEIFNDCKCSVKEFAELLEIPYTTVIQWLKCTRQLKKYILDLIIYKLNH